MRRWDWTLRRTGLRGVTGTAALLRGQGKGRGNQTDSFDLKKTNTAGRGQPRGELRGSQFEGWEDQAGPPAPSAHESSGSPSAEVPRVGRAPLRELPTPHGPESQGRENPGNLRTGHYFSVLGVPVPSIKYFRI